MIERIDLVPGAVVMKAMPGWVTRKTNQKEHVPCLVVAVIPHADRRKSTEKSWWTLTLLYFDGTLLNADISEGDLGFWTRLF